MVEILWKTMTGILNLRLTAAIHFHDSLHGFHTGIGTGKASLEANLIQQLMDMREEVLCEIFLDLHKTYDTLYHDQCLYVLAMYRVVPQSIRLLRRY